MSLTQYVALLKSAASTMDLKRSRGAARQGNVHDATASDDATSTDATTDDDELAQLEAYMSRQRVPGSSMDKETWQSLDKSTHSAWDMISPEDKAKILSYAMERANKNKQAAANRNISANVAEQAESDAPDTPGDDSEESPSAEGTSDTLEANLSKSGRTHPGDLRRMMGKQPKKSGSNPKRAGNTVHFEINTLRTGSSEATDPSSDGWGDASEIPSSKSVPPFQNDDSASLSSGPDEIDGWGTAPPPSTAYEELDAWANHETQAVSGVGDDIRSHDRLTMILSAWMLYGMRTWISARAIDSGFRSIEPFPHHETT